jgi:hypothetical protein
MHEHHHEPEHTHISEHDLLAEILGVLRDIRREVAPPRLTTIRINFQGEEMATIGPVTLTTAGQSVTASIAGFDQFGNPWTGVIPPVTYTIDNPSVATSTPNADGLTDGVVAVANGVANLTATLTTAEGLALTDTETVTVAISGGGGGTPVLSSIKIQFA